MNAMDDHDSIPSAEIEIAPMIRNNALISTEVKNNDVLVSVVTSQQTLTPNNQTPPNRHHSKAALSPLTEARQLFNIAAPTIFVQFSNLLLWTETASTIGHSNSTTDNDNDIVANLSGFSLAELSVNICIAIIIGTLSASDTLIPQAYGARNFREVGILATRGYIVTLSILLPLGVALWNARVILTYLGQDPKTAELAASWIRIFVVALPFWNWSYVAQQFLTLQEVVMPLAYCGFITCFVVNPVSLRLFVRLFGEEYRGAAVGMTVTHVMQLLLVWAYLSWMRPFKNETWVGIGPALREALYVPSLMSYYKLGFGGLLSIGEWIYWESICFIVGKLGPESLSVHTIPYQLLPLLFMLPYGLSIGLNVRLGSTLPKDVEQARKLVYGCLTFGLLMAVVVATIVYIHCVQIVSLYTTDERIIEGCLRIWHRVSILILTDTLLAINSSVLRALGLQWRMGVATITMLCCLAMPHIYYVSVNQGGGLEALWNVLPLWYILLNIVWMACYLFADWDDISNTIRKREGMDLNCPDCDDERIDVLKVI